MTHAPAEDDDTGAVAMRGPRRHVLAKLEGFAAVPVALVFGTLFARLIYRYADMFPLIEYRQWIFHAPQTALLTSRPFAHVFQLNVDPSRFQIAFSRSTSLWLSTLFGRVCGPTPSCHNGLHALMLVASVVLIGLSVRALSISRSWFPAVAAGVLVALSVPVLDAVTWQATLLDKTAMLLTAATILAAARIRVEDGGLRHVAAVNVSLFVLTFAAYNAKEAALFLGPATVLLVWLRAKGAGLTAAAASRRALVLTALPFAYACLHVAIVFYNRTVLEPGEMSRVTGGNLAFNAEYYARYMLDMFGGSWTVRDLEMVGAGLLLFVAVAVALDLRDGARRHVPLSLFALLAMAGSLTISLRTSSTSPFYLLVPMVYFGLAVGLSLDSVLARLPGPALRLACIGLCTALLAARTMALGGALPDFDHLEDLSTHFQRTLGAVRDAARQDPFGRIVFVRPEHEQRAYMYVSSPADAGDYALAPYIAPPGATMADLLAIDARIRDVSPAQVPAALRPGDVVVTLAPDLSLENLTRVP